MIGSAGGGVQRIFIVRPSRFQIAAIKQPIALEIRNLRQERIAFYLLCKLTGLLQTGLRFVTSPQKGQSVAIATQDVSQPRAMILKLPKDFQGLILRFQSCAVPALVLKNFGRTVGLDRRVALVTRAAVEVECSQIVG